MVTYGVISAPYLEINYLCKLCNGHKMQYLFGSACLEKDFYEITK